jgi:acetoin utilization deacetylase AcuC-like enzyme
MKVVFHEDFYEVYTSDPAALAGRMESIVAELPSWVELVSARPADVQDILAVHTDDHVEHVRSQGLYPIASLAAGGAIQAALLGLETPCFALIRPPGHHASEASSWGFCYFNNMAVALKYLLDHRKIKTAYVLDIDLHYGDGTVNVLQRYGNIALHNVSAASRDAYLEEVRQAMERCRSAVIGISAGFDLHEEDWGGVLKTEDYFQIGQWVRQSALRNGGGCFGVLEGGYNHSVLGQNVKALLKGLDGQN